jgi:hypothetical protein
MKMDHAAGGGVCGWKALEENRTWSETDKECSMVGWREKRGEGREEERG